MVMENLVESLGDDFKEITLLLFCLVYYFLHDPVFPELRLTTWLLDVQRRSWDFTDLRSYKRATYFTNLEFAPCMPSSKGVSRDLQFVLQMICNKIIVISDTDNTDIWFVICCVCVIFRFIFATITQRPPSEISPQKWIHPRDCPSELVYPIQLLIIENYHLKACLIYQVIISNISLYIYKLHMKLYMYIKWFSSICVYKMIPMWSSSHLSINITKITINQTIRMHHLKFKNENVVLLLFIYCKTCIPTRHIKNKLCVSISCHEFIIEILSWFLVKFLRFDFQARRPYH